MWLTIYTRRIVTVAEVKVSLHFLCAFLCCFLQLLFILCTGRQIGHLAFAMSLHPEFYQQPTVTSAFHR